MKPHSLSTYRDGYQQVHYCSVCGAEGDQLSLDCVSLVIDMSREEFQEKYGFGVDKLYAAD